MFWSHIQSCETLPLALEEIYQRRNRSSGTHLAAAPLICILIRTILLMIGGQSHHTLNENKYSWPARGHTRTSAWLFRGLLCVYIIFYFSLCLHRCHDLWTLLRIKRICEAQQTWRREGHHTEHFGLCDLAKGITHLMRAYICLCVRKMYVSCNNGIA